MLQAGVLHVIIRFLSAVQLWIMQKNYFPHKHHIILYLEFIHKPTVHLNFMLTLWGFNSNIWFLTK